MKEVKFSDFDLSPEILRAMSDLNYDTPTPIQIEALPLMLARHDLIGQAQTGTGKTLAFAIPLIEQIERGNALPQGLVMCPTRELVQQVSDEFRRLVKYRKDIQILPIYGGAYIGEQLRALKNNPQIIVGTPGRLLDHIRRKSLKLGAIRMLVLDEADEMLDMGFRDDIDSIIAETPKERQTVLFSATMNRDILKLMDNYQREAVKVDVTSQKKSSPAITQYVFEVREKQKPEALIRLMALHNINLAVVFCNTKRAVDSLVQFLKTSGYSAEALHGDLTQKMREKVMGTFRTGKIRILAATDIAGRGIDVRNIEAVFNYDLPLDDEDYVHRIGRTGRAGATGIAFTLMTRSQQHLLRRIERNHEMTLQRKTIPSVKELESHLREREITSLVQAVQSEDLGVYRKQVEAFSKQMDVSIGDIAAALLKHKSKERVEKFNDAEDFAAFSEVREERYSKSRGGSGNRRYSSSSRSNKDARGGKSKRAGSYKPQKPTAKKRPAKAS